MSVFYEMKDDELQEYMSMSIYNQEELRDVINWINFRKKYPFLSWLVQEVASVAFRVVFFGQ